MALTLCWRRGFKEEKHIYKCVKYEKNRERIILLEKIHHINLAIKNKSYLSALALSLTLPDICGEIEYPDFKHDNGRRNVGKQYKTWFDNWVAQYYADYKGWTADYTKAKNPIFTGEMCYHLRCSFLHSGNSDIKDWGPEKDADFDCSYEFNLAVGRVDSVSSSSFWENSRRKKTISVTVSIDSLCESICLAANKYYHEKGPAPFEDHKINFVDFNSFIEAVDN